jgi:hypothetical protein
MAVRAGAGEVVELGCASDIITDAGSLRSHQTATMEVT